MMSDDCTSDESGFARNAWLLELPSQVTKLTWTNAACTSTTGTLCEVELANGTRFGGDHQPCCRVATDTQIYVSFGAAPNAGTDTERFLITAGATEYFYVKSGDKAAVVAA